MTARGADLADRSADSAARGADSANSSLALQRRWSLQILTTADADLCTITGAMPLHLGGQWAIGVHLLGCMGGLSANRALLDLLYHNWTLLGRVYAGVTGFMRDTGWRNLKPEYQVLASGHQVHRYPVIFPISPFRKQYTHSHARTHTHTNTHTHTHTHVYTHTLFLSSAMPVQAVSITAWLAALLWEIM